MHYWCWWWEEHNRRRAGGIRFACGSLGKIITYQSQSQLGAQNIWI